MDITHPCDDSHCFVFDCVEIFSGFLSVKIQSVANAFLYICCHDKYVRLTYVLTTTQQKYMFVFSFTSIF